MYFGNSLSHQFEGNVVVFVFWRVSAAWQRLTSYSYTYLEANLGFKIGSVAPFAIFTRFGTRRLELFGP
jgi:hypothetical protein